MAPSFAKIVAGSLSVSGQAPANIVSEAPAPTIQVVQASLDEALKFSESALVCRFNGFWPQLTALHSWISEIWVYGNSFESFLVAIVIPDQKALENWAATNEVTGNFESLCENQKAKQYILHELNATGKNHKLKGFEMLKGIHLELKPFDVERDLITPTFKLKRPQLLKYYKDIIDDLYKTSK